MKYLDAAADSFEFRVSAILLAYMSALIRYRRRVLRQNILKHVIIRRNELRLHQLDLIFARLSAL